MLKRVGDREFPGKTEVFIKEASFPVPFQPGLEFNSPAHGNWNIVHTGMLVPEAQQIYVCADNCMRGVVLTAAEMNAADRFSFVIVEEKDLLELNSITRYTDCEVSVLFLLRMLHSVNEFFCCHAASRKYVSGKTIRDHKSKA